jgi:DNA replication protein
MSVARYAGFPDRLTYVPVPAPFFGTLLREIDTLGELKTTLHILRLLHDRGQVAARAAPGPPGDGGAQIAAWAPADGPAAGAAPGLRFVRRSELLADRALLLSLRGDAATAPERALASALARAVERGTLLEVAVRDDEAEDVCYFLNTTTNRRTVREVRAGEWSLGPLAPLPLPAEIDGRPSDRPTIFELYEQNVGLLTPLLAEELREAEERYPESWIEDAFREAVVLNKRSWRYVKRILESWATGGRGTSGENRRRADPPEDSRSYLTGKYGRLIRR